MPARRAKATYIGNIRFEPKSSIEKPYLFGSFESVLTFAAITGHRVFAVVPQDPLIYEVWPSRKIKEWPGGDIEKSFERTNVA